MTAEAKGSPIPHIEAHAPPALGSGGGGSVWPWLIVAAVGAAGGLYYFAPALGLTAKKPGSTGGAAATPSAKPVPVVVATARQGDMPIYLTGLGTVTAFNTVTLHSRVDGELMNVAFTEGQLVHEGDLLAEIDPRPVRGPAHAGAGSARPGPGPARERADQPRALRGRQGRGLATRRSTPQAATVRQIDGALKTDQAQIENAQAPAHLLPASPRRSRAGSAFASSTRATSSTPTTRRRSRSSTQVQPIAVVFPLPEDDLAAVARTSPTRARGLPSRPYDRELKEKLASGTLLTLDNQVDPSTGTVKLKASSRTRTRRSSRISSSTRGSCVETKARGGDRPGRRGPARAPGRRSSTSSRRTATRPSSATVDAGPDRGRCDVAIEAGASRPGETVVVEGVDKLQPGHQGCGVSASESAEEARRQAGRSAVSFSRLFILRPVATTLLMVGDPPRRARVAYEQLPVSALPQVDYPTISVQTFYPGREPRRHGLVGDGAARAAVRTAPGPRRR